MPAIPLLRLHPHQTSFVAKSVNEDILLVKNDVEKLASWGFSLKNLTEVLPRLPGHLLTYSRLFTEQSAMLIY